MTVRLVAAILAYSSLAMTAQQPPAASSDQAPAARFGAAASGVVVDVVVRDKRGRPVSNLSAADFSVFEDGVRQQVVAFEPYTAADVPQTVDEAAAAAGLPASGKGVKRHRLAEGPPVIALAWDRLQPEGRAIAHQAARRLIQTKARGEVVGVFLTDMTLQTIQPYTTDERLLEAAVETLATSATTSQTREPSPLDTIVGRAETSPTASAEDSGYALSGFPNARSERSAGSAGERPEGPPTTILGMLLRMERTYREFLTESQGRASMLGLLALVDSLGELPGRKTVLYFCEGLTIPDSQQARFRAVIDAANRHNVSVYTFDAAGLRVHSAQQQTAREIRELTFTATGPVEGRSYKWTEELENNERLLKMDPAVSLNILANQTGGLLSNNTNALDKAIDRINDDRRHHYLLSYVSTNPTLDGSYRHIAVAVSRPDVEVRARRGYRASPSLMSTPVLEYERPALSALSEQPAPAAFPVAAMALRTPMPGRLGLISLLVAAGGRSLTVARSDDGTQYRAGATVLARVVDGAQHEAARVSQQYLFTGDFDQRDTHRRGVLFLRTAIIPPGTHAFEAVVHDVEGERSAVLRQPLIVESSDGIGDLIVVRNIGAAPAVAEGSPPHPLVWQDQVLTPSTGEPVNLRDFRDLTIALPMVVAAPPRASLELRRLGTLVETFPLEVAMPESDGRLMIVATLPLGQRSAGTYDLVAVITIDGKVTTRRATFSLVEQ